MSYIDKVNQVLASRGYDPNARLADYRDPNAYQAPKAPASQGNFLGNVGKSLGSIPGALGKGITDSLGQTSFAKMPQIAESIGRTGFSLGPINIKGSVNKRLEQRDALMAQAQKDFKAGRIDGKEYARRLNKAIADTNVEKDLKKSEGALKDASRYGEQYVNTASWLSLGAGGIAGALGKTGMNAASKVAIGEAYSGTAKALASGAFKEAGKTFGKGVLAETAGLAKPFMGGAGKGGIIKGITGALGGALEGQAMASTFRDLNNGKVDPLNAALTVGSVLPGGPLGAAGAALKGTGKLASKAIYDTHGIYDVITLKGGKTVNQILEELAKSNPKAYKQLSKILAVGEDLATQEHGKGADTAARAIEANQPSGKKFADMTIEEFAKAMSGNQGSRKQVQTAVKQAMKEGFELPDGKGPVLGRITPAAKSELSKRLAASDDPAAEMAKIAKEGIDVEGQKLKNVNLIGQLQDIVDSGRKGDDLANAINKKLTATQMTMVNGKPILTKNGLFLALADNPGVVKNPSKVAAITKGSKAPLGVIGRTLDKIGLSTKSADPAEQKAIFNQVKNNFIEAVNDDDSIKVSGKDILGRLNSLTDKKTGVFDIRQLTKKEIADVLGGDKAEAKKIMGYYNDAFKSLSFKDRGLAGKLTDFNMRNNPLAAPYSRIQSVARYELNPFFRAQENTETALGSALAGRAPVMPRTTKYNKTVKVLEDAGFFKKELAGNAGEGAAGLGAVSAKLSPFQKSQFAKDIENMSGGGKENVLKFINDPKNTDLIQNIKTIAQYPDRGLTSSNFMKAMNLAVFPMRYNIKVTEYAAKALAKQSGPTQMAVIKGIKDFSDWQKTPEGIKWNSDNSEIIGLLRYFTPVGTVESALRMLSPGEVRGVKDLGQIGGLPFGVISRVLQGQGITKSATPYLNPKTGEVVPDKIPADAKARASQALADIIDTMFTFPGRLVDAPLSKKQISQGAAEWATLGTLKGGKYESVTRTDLTDKQKKTQAVLRAGQASPVLKGPSTVKNRSVDISSKKAPTITPIYKTTAKGKKVKAKASAPGTWRP